jgi:hypothetical protein
MSAHVSFEPHPARPRLRVELDGRPVILPGEMESSLVSIRAYLEFLALQQRRVLSGFLVDGIEVNQIKADAPDSGYQHVCGDTITFEELSHRLIETASRQLQRLSSQMQEAALRIVISEREQIETQWREWQPQLRSPLVSLGFLRELWGPAVDAIMVGGHSLAEHLEELNPLVCQIDAIFLAAGHEWLDEDAIALSTTVEECLVPWLKILEVYLLKLHQQPLV